MGRSTDIYQYDKRLLLARRKLEATEMNERNKKLIKEFMDYCSLIGLSKPRVIKYSQVLRLLDEFIGMDFDKITKKDIERAVATINNKEEWAAATKYTIKAMLKRFYKWLLGNDEEYPKEVSWIKTAIKRTERKLPNEGDLLSEEDVIKAIEHTRNLRDKALISTLYESGCRIGELSSLRIRDVAFDKAGVVLSVTGKTGPRQVRIVSSTPYLANWINHHPLKDDREAPMWISIGGRNQDMKMHYETIRAMICHVFKKAGIKKRHNPHIFRHSRATFLANHLTEFQMNQYFGWVQGSDMAATYVHLSGKQIDDAILGVNGMKKKEEKPIQRSVVCKRCDTINIQGSTYCCKCGSVVDSLTAIRLDEEEKEQKFFHDISNETIKRMMEERPRIVMKFLQELTGVADNKVLVQNSHHIPK